MRCGNKEVTDLNRVMDQYYSDDPPNPSRPPSDKIYFFHYLLYEGSSLTSFDAELEAQAYDKLSGYLNERAKNGFQAKEIAQRVKTLNDKIRSANIDFSRNRILLDLPHSDEGKCVDIYKDIPPEVLNVPTKPATKKGNDTAAQ